MLYILGWIGRLAAVALFYMDYSLTERLTRHRNVFTIKLPSAVTLGGAGDGGGAFPVDQQGYAQGATVRHLPE